MARRKRNAVEAYAHSVLDGKELAGPYVRAACERHFRDMERHGKDLWFDEDEANTALSFFPDILVLAGGEHEGVPFELLPWQSFLTGSLYGWFIEIPGEGWQRRFRVAYIETGKGSGKTPLIAGFGIRSICADREPRAECYVLARTKEQTEVTFRAATSMIEQSPYLRNRLHISGGMRPNNIAHIDSGSWMERVSSDSQGKGKSGPIPHVVICDEYHEHDTDNMLEFFRAGNKKRQRPLTAIITNAGISSTSPCGREHGYACRVVTGEVDDDRYFAYVCALDDTDDPYDPEQEACWRKTNPSLPITPTTTYIREEVKKAIGMPSKKSKVDRLQFCRWVDAETPWIEREKWIACEATEEQRPPLEVLQKCPSFVTLDLSKRNDLTSGAHIFLLPSGRLWAEVESWTPRDGLDQRSNRDGVPYREWVDAGYLVATPGSIVDLGYVATWIMRKQEEWPNLVGVAFDPYKMEYLEKELDDLGVYHSRDRRPGYLYLISHAQGMRPGPDHVKKPDEEKNPRPRLYMPHSIDETENAILVGELKALYNPVLRMAVLAAITAQDASENRRFAKNKATARIDPCVALAMGVGFARAKHLGAGGSAMIAGLYD